MRRSAFSHMLKAASVKETAKHLAEGAAGWARANSSEIAGSAIGAGLLAAGAYLSSKPGKSGRSIEQGEKSVLKKPSKDETFAKGLIRIWGNAKTEIADLAAKHPAAMAIASMPTGALMGKAIASKLKTASGTIEEKIEFSDNLGRVLAHAMNKTANWSAVGKKVGELGQHVMRTNVAKRMAVGAAVGAGGEMVAGNRPTMGSVLGSAGVGAAAGAAAKPILKRMRPTSGSPGGAFKKGVGEGLQGWQKKGK